MHHARFLKKRQGLLVSFKIQFRFRTAANVETVPSESIEATADHQGGFVENFYLQFLQAL